MTAITEYNLGALDHINGALAQADLLGVFGREGLDMAAIWAPPGAGTPGFYAYKIYRNYDDAGNGFGDVSVSARSEDQSKLSVYAAERSSDHALTVLVVNKSFADLSSTIALSGFRGASTAAACASAPTRRGSRGCRIKPSASGRSRRPFLPAR